MKKTWITSLAHDENYVQKIIAQLKAYRIPVDGNFWVNDLPKMAWYDSCDLLTNLDVAAWIIIVDATTIANKDIFKGLSALSLTVTAKREYPLPIILVANNCNIEPDLLPTVLKDALIITDITKLGVKVVAAINQPPRAMAHEYRIRFHPLNELGLWLEIGPTNEIWDGVILGVSDGEINFQACGEAGTLPEKCVLEYPEQGLKMAFDDIEFGGWSVRNQIDATSSYYARLTQLPEQILFASNTVAANLDAYTIKLC